MLTTNDRLAADKAIAGKALNRMPLTKRQKMFRMGLISIGALSLLGLVVAFLLSTSKAHETKVSGKEIIQPVLTVSVQSVSLCTMERIIAVNGAISAWDPVAVSSTISGLETRQVLVDENCTVKRGQILAILDDSQIRPQLESERAKLRADVGALKKSIQPNRTEDIAALEAAEAQAKANVLDQKAALEQAKANLYDANQNVKRYSLLATQGAVSTQDYETRVTNAKVAKAVVNGAAERARASEFALRQITEKLSMARAGGRSEDIDIARANVDQTRSNIKRLEAQLAQTIIRSPVDGLITKRDVHLGDVSASGKTMFCITRDSRLELRAQVPESDLAAIQPGETVNITSALATGVTGKVREISPLVDATTRLATVRIDLQQNPTLKPGSFADGQINAGKYTAIAVPIASVIFKDNVSSVFVVVGNRACRKTIVTGTQSDNLIEVKSGLSIGERVVVKGAGFLKDQDIVAVGN